MELFNDHFESNKLHKYYRMLQTSDYQHAKEILKNWASDFPDRDNKFVDEFQTTFNSSFWELYIYAVLKEMDCKCDFSYFAPDFVIGNDKSIDLLIECTIANPPKDGIREEDPYEKIYHLKIDVEKSVDISTVRLMNSITSKWKWRLKNISSNPQFDNIPFIIAVAPFDQPNFQIPNMQAIRRVIFSHDKTVYSDGEYYDYVIEDYVKNNGSSLELGIFTNDKYSDITGVLFSCTATMSKIHALSNIQDVIFLHNRYNPSSYLSELGINFRFKHKNYKDYSKKREQFEMAAMQYDTFSNPDSSKYYKRDPYIQMDYHESLADGLFLFLNPFAKNKISDQLVKTFINTGISVATYNPKTDYEQEVHYQDKGLLQRSTIRMKHNK